MNLSKKRRIPEFDGTWRGGLSITDKLYRLYKPYLKDILLIGIAATFVGLLTGSSQVTLTPLLDLVLSGGQISLDLEGPLTAPTLDLSEIGQYLLNVFARMTGLTEPFQLMIFTSMFYLVIAVTVQFLAFLLRVWQVNLQFFTQRDLVTGLFTHVLRMPLSFATSKQIGWLKSRINDDVAIATRDLLKLLVDGVASSTTSLFYFILLVSTDVRLTVVAAIAGVLHISVTRLLSERVKGSIRENQKQNANIGGYLIERLASIREVKAFSAESIEKNRMFERYNGYAQQRVLLETYRNIEKPLRWSVNRTVIIVVMLFGVYLLLNDELTITGFGLFMFFAQSLIGPLSVLAGLVVQVAGVLGALDEVFNIITLPTEQAGTTHAPRRIVQRIEFKGVSFAYFDDPVLHHIDLQVNAGEMVALVGQSGAGKSTIADLLLRFYMPSSGEILLDGVPIQEYDLHSYRQMFGVVSQEATLLDDTIANNIAYGRPDLTRGEIEKAARIANAEPFILNDLPDGYDTMLGERGVRLSGGQRQRISIARAVAHKPPILILDEATSALDTASERLVQQAIDEVVKGNTALVIAHRLSTIRRADRIVVLNRGRIIEQGTHDKLIAAEGTYYRLYQQQFSDEGLLAPIHSADTHH